MDTSTLFWIVVVAVVFYYIGKTSATPSKRNDKKTSSNYDHVRSDYNDFDGDAGG